MFWKMVRIVVADFILPDGFVVIKEEVQRTITLDKKDYRWLSQDTKAAVSGG